MSLDSFWRTVGVLLVLWVAPAFGQESPEVGTAEQGGATESRGDRSDDSLTAYFFALSVDDVEASAAWYERVLGLRTVRRHDLEERDLRIRLLSGTEVLLELVERGDSRSLKEWAPSADSASKVHGVFKIGLRVEDLESTLERLRELGVPLRGRVVAETDGSMRSAQIEDPDGIVIQLFELLDEPTSEEDRAEVAQRPENRHG